MKKTLTVLASDFKDNYWSNTEIENGCPMQRAFKRAGIIMGEGEMDFYNCSPYMSQKSVREAENRVISMFFYKEPIIDFSFEITSPNSLNY